MVIKHTKVSAIADGGDTNLVQPSDWNADHTGTNDHDHSGVTGSGGELSLYTSADGWKSADGIWTFSSADAPTYVVSVNADMTTTIGVGMRIKVTHATVKYFIVIAVGAYSGGATLITLYGGTDYTLAVAGDAITNPFYSNIKAPFGFPLSYAKWTVEVTDTGNRAQTTPSINTWYNVGTISISIPIGYWKVNYNCELQLTDTASQGWAGFVTLSTANNSESDTTFTTYAYFNAILSWAINMQKENYLTLAAKTSYYLNVKTSQSGLDSIAIRGDGSKTIIRATCGYL